MAMSKPLAWVKQTPKPVEMKPVEEKKAESKPLIKTPTVVHTAAGRLIMILAPKAMCPKNNQNAANPRPGSPALEKMAKNKALPPLPSVEKKLMITIPRELGITPYKQYCQDQKAVIDQKKEEKEQTCFQNECWDKLRKARCKEYVSFQNMITILREICAEPL